MSGGQLQIAAVTRNSFKEGNQVGDPGFSGRSRAQEGKGTREAASRE